MQRMDRREKASRINVSEGFYWVYGKHGHNVEVCWSRKDQNAAANS